MKYKKGLGRKIQKIHTETQSIEDISFLLDSSDSKPKSWGRKLQTLNKSNPHHVLKNIITEDLKTLHNLETTLQTLKERLPKFHDPQIVSFLTGFIQATDKKLKYYYI
jgi:hypothetical protein